jgi:hypothetical protein
VWPGCGGVGQTDGGDGCARSGGKGGLEWSGPGGPMHPARPEHYWPERPKAARPIRMSWVMAVASFAEYIFAKGKRKVKLRPARAG